MIAWAEHWLIWQLFMDGHINLDEAITLGMPGWWWTIDHPAEQGT